MYYIANRKCKSKGYNNFLLYMHYTVVLHMNLLLCIMHEHIQYDVIQSACLFIKVTQVS